MPSSPPIVLVLDDDSGTRTLLTVVVERQGLRAHAVADAEQALADATLNPPDLILLDLMLPGLNGYQFLRRYRAEIDAHTPVLVISAKAEALERSWALSMGAVRCFTKPFSVAELGHAIVEILHFTPELHGGAPRA